MAASSSTFGLVADYSQDSDEDEEASSSSAANLVTNVVRLPSVNSAPVVQWRGDIGGLQKVDPHSKELNYNPKFDELFAPVTGPKNPFKSDSQGAQKNQLAGFVEPAHFNQFHFESERKTFTTFGYAKDPTAKDNTNANYADEGNFVGDKKSAVDNKGATVFESRKTGHEKRKMETNWDSADLEGYTGPWGKYVDEELASKPDADTLKVMEEFAKKRKRYKKRTKTEDENKDETSTLHIKDPVDYQGRSFMHPPADLGINFRADSVPDRCFIPKKQTHVYQAHAKGVQCIRWLPASAHLLLSSGMDSKIKLWEVYGNRRCIRTYLGHKMAVRDVNFNNDGTQFLSASFDRHIKLWDTETGECVSRFTTGKTPFCVVFNPDSDKQNMFLSGMQDKKIIQWDTRSGEIVQEYDRHLGTINSITFFDNNRRFCSTSDDKSMRIWEWEIPVDTKLIQDASLHSMPFMKVSPNAKWMCGQAMDNRIVLFQMIDEKLRFAKKKAFKGHMTAGYACGVDWSPDMKYLCSGDSNGRLFVWEWKTHRIVAKWKAHEQVCIGALWHPHETSKVATCGWDGLVKLWD